MPSSASTPAAKPCSRPAGSACSTASSARRALEALTLLLLALLPLAAPAAQRIQAGSVCITPAAATDCTAQPVTLPFHWDIDHSRHDGSARFEFTLDAAAFGPPAPALYLPRVGNAFEVRLNGTLVHRVGERGTQRHDTVKRPWLLPLPAGALQPGANTLTVTIHAAAGRAAQLAAPTVGSYAALEPLFDREWLWRVQLTGALMWMAFVLGLMSLAVWVVQREPLFAAYAIAELAWGLRLAEMFAIEMPLPWQLWGAGVAALFGISQLAMTYFLLHAVGRWSGAFRRGYLAYLAVWVAMVPLVAVGRLRELWIGWVGFGVVLLVALALYIAWRSFRERHFWRWLFASFVVLNIVTGTLDVIESPGSMYMHPTWARLVWGGFSLALALLVGRRLQRSRQQLLAANAAMRDALAQQDQELRAALSAQAAADLKRAMHEERERVMRDMHDGLGGQLSGLLSLAGNPATPPAELQGQVRQAIDELRLIVDAMAPHDGNLATMLGSLRPRLERRLAAAGVTLGWEVDELPPSERLTPSAVQHLQRLLLEAVTNVARHAQARHAVLRARAAADAIELELHDDGRGFDAGAAHAGHGLRNMRWRAQALGAEFSVQGSGSTTVRLRLPL